MKINQTSYILICFCIFSLTLALDIKHLASNEIKHTQSTNTNIIANIVIKLYYIGENLSKNLFNMLSSPKIKPILASGYSVLLITLLIVHIILTLFLIIVVS